MNITRLISPFYRFGEVAVSKKVHSGLTSGGALVRHYRLTPKDREYVDSYMHSEARRKAINTEIYNREYWQSFRDTVSAGSVIFGIFGFMMVAGSR